MKFLFFFNCPPSSQLQIIFHRFGQLQWCISCLYWRWSIRWRCFQGIQTSQLLFFLNRNLLSLCNNYLIWNSYVMAAKTKWFPIFLMSRNWETEDKVLVFLSPNFQKTQVHLTLYKNQTRQAEFSHFIFSYSILSYAFFNITDEYYLCTHFMQVMSFLQRLVEWKHMSQRARSRV